MRIFLTGGTGYVGRQILRDLCAKGHAVTTLVRPGSRHKLPDELRRNVALIEGDILRPESYANAFHKCEACINLPGILREFPSKGVTFEGVHFRGTKLLIDLAGKNAPIRFIQMSALGVRQGAATKYQKTKYRAEEYLKASGMHWTIFRPSLMFGNEKEGLMNFMTVLKDLLAMAPFVVPVLGDGKYRFQPVAVQNVSEGFVEALERPEAIGKTYDVAGPDRFSYNELLDIVSRVVGVNKIKLHQPMTLMKIAALLFGRFQFFPVSRDQITMLQEENISDRWEEFFYDFNITPLRLVENIQKGF
ncbi:MAG TPA: complex I NDUFA9 subunit family protein [Bacteroidota bacterium]|nr:complex I NDUFA9 subunit family protein [Bacteroidota bacterium]